MKPGDNHDLLDSLLDEAADSSAPSADQMLAGIRQTRRARNNRRVIVGTVVSVFVIALLLAQRIGVAPPLDQQAIQPLPTTNVAAVPDPSPSSVEPVSSPAAEPTWQVDRIDDQQLLELLDVPVALVQHSDGNRQLMLMVRAEP